MKSFAIIGLGLFGRRLAKQLHDAGHTVLAIDSNEKIVEELADSVSSAVTLDARNRSALAQLGIDKYDCIAVAITGDLSTSVLVTMNLKALNVPQIVCKVQNDADQEVLETLGASLCIIPEQIAATKMVKTLTNDNIVDYIQLSDDYSILEIHVPTSWIGKSIIALNIRAQYGVNIIGIRNKDNIRVDFEPAMLLKEDDELIIIGSNKNINKLQKL